MPKISVIVPVYNVEQYLGVCIDSILSQTLTDIEIICVDDGSTDKSSEILDAYALEDERVRVIHRENHGYGQSLNVGIAAAAGEYIGIVESDDKILCDMYEKLYCVAREYDLDFIKSDCIFWWDTLNYVYEYHKNPLNPYYDRVLDHTHRKIFFDFFMNIWTGIYKREFLKKNGIFCNETPGASYQDNGFWIQTMSLAEKAMWMSKAFYMYRQDNPGSSIKSKSKAMAMKEEYDFAERILEQKHREKELDLCRYFRMLRHKGTFIRISDELKRDYCEEIIGDFEKYGELITSNKEVYYWMRRLCEDPEAFCDDYIKNKARTLQQLEGAEVIFIYGAGNCGQKALRILNYQNLSSKVVCFVVSDQAAVGYVGKVSIHCIDDLTNYSQKALVVIGADEQSAVYRQMKLRLEELGFTHTLNFSMLLHYFYYVV